MLERMVFCIILFYQVKVAIYNNGVEKANIVFNAIGANKDNWFDKSRIISSTYTDIMNAPKEFFSMIGYVLYLSVQLVYYNASFVWISLTNLLQIFNNSIFDFGRTLISEKP